MITTNTEKNMNKKRETRINNMEDILRGELSAIEAYQQVMETVNDNPEVTRLTEFLADHREAASYWKKKVRVEHETPDSMSGAWGTFVQAFVGSAKLLGNTAALKALKEGEEHGLNQYENLLAEDDISAVDKDHLRKVLIPNQKRHINNIDAMMKMQ